jgi:hypothetical protein
MSQVSVTFANHHYPRYTLQECGMVGTQQFSPASRYGLEGSVALKTPTSHPDWRIITVKLSTLSVAASLCLALAGHASAQTATQNPALKYKAGQRVEYIDNGKWFKAVITGVRDDSADHLDHKIYAPYQIHSLGYVGDHWVCYADFSDRRSQLRPAGSGPTEPVPGGEANDPVLSAVSGTTAAKPTQPAAKEYTCGVGSPIKLTGNGSYNGGTYSFNAASSTLTFKGGDYDGQRAVYEISYGLARLHILGPSGRPVIDCD